MCVLSLRLLVWFCSCIFLVWSIRLLSLSPSLRYFIFSHRNASRYQFIAIGFVVLLKFRILLEWMEFLFSVARYYVLPKGMWVCTMSVYTYVFLYSMLLVLYYYQYLLLSRPACVMVIRSFFCSALFVLIRSLQFIDFGMVGNTVWKTSTRARTYTHTHTHTVLPPLKTIFWRVPLHCSSHCCISRCFLY